MKQWNKAWLGGSLGAVLLVVPVMVGAATFRGGNQQDVTIDSPVLDDLYAAGNRVVVKEDVAEDVMVLGQAISISSVIGEDVYALGQFVRLQGTIEDDAHAAGNQVEIEGRVEGDVLAAGQSITIAESAVVTGDVLAAGQSITIAGDVQGSVKVASEHLVVTDGATVGGDVVVYGQQPQIAEGAVINGEVSLRERAPAEGSAGQTILLGWVRGVLGQFVLALLLAMALPVLIAQTMKVAEKRPGKSLLIGFAWLVLMIPAVFLLFFTLFGIPLALLVVFGSGVLVVAGSGVAALMTGRWLLKRLEKGRVDSEARAVWPEALLGAAVYNGIQLLGPPGWIVSWALLTLGMGALLVTAWNKRT